MMQLENLERRLALSVSHANGVLSIVGTHMNDWVTLSMRDGDVVVKSNFDPETQVHLLAGEGIKIDLRAGNDRSAINNIITASTTILGGSGNVEYLIGARKHE